MIQGATFGETLRRLRKIVLSQRQRTDTPTGRGACNSTTHPSDHNSISVDSRVRKQRREAWRIRWQRKRNREGPKLKNSKGKAKNGDVEARHVRGQERDNGVAVPLPLMYGYGYPFESSEYPGLSVEVSSCFWVSFGCLRWNLIILGHCWV